MARRRRKNILFPFGGLNRQGAYRQQKPYTTMDCLNVRPKATIEGRERGGSRPALDLSHLDNLGSEVRLLSPMILLPSDNFTTFSDTFGGTVMAAHWTVVAGSTLPNILPTSLASIDDSVADADVDLDDLTDLQISSAYSVELYIVPWNGAHHGKYRLKMRMDDATPDMSVEGVVVELDLGGAGGGSVTDGTWTGTITSYLASTPTVTALTGGSDGQAEPGWLIASVSGDTVSVWWNGTQILNAQAVDTHTGKRTGFALECTEASGLNLAWVYRVQYYGTANTLRSKLIASAGGDIYQESTYGRMTVVSSSLTVRSDLGLNATQSGQKLYIADHGWRVNGTDGVTTSAPDTLDAATVSDWTAHSISTDNDVVVISDVGGATVAGTYKISSIASGALTLASDPGAGTCSFRVERAPKIYDPEANTLTIMAATAGQMPSGNPLIARYLDRIVVAGAESAAHVWYMSRVAAPLDWDYSLTDSRRAISGVASEAGVPGDPLTALVPHSDDYLILACRNSIWRMRGDPAFGAALSALSRAVGIIGPKAWCLGPEGELIFLSLDGLYVLPPGGNSDPKQLSRDILPMEFLNIDPNVMTVLLEYDIHAGGVHIYLTSDSTNSRKHWWLDWQRKTFWPMTLPTTMEPTATCQLQGIAVEDDGVILGGRDGSLRRMTELSETDSGTAFASWILIGPVPLAGDMLEGSVLVMSAVMAVGSGDVTWSLRPSATFEGSLTASEQDAGTWVAGLGATAYPACRGQAYTMLLTGESGRKWAMESITTVIREAGRRRRA